MNNFFSELSLFLIQHWPLAAAFIIALFIWIGFEFRLSFSGIPQLNPSDATLFMNRRDVFIVDVRDFTSYEKGHITQAINIPIVDLNKGNGKLDAHKERPILLVCAQGNQALAAANTLKKQGFGELSILKGGMSAWLQESLPIVKGLKVK